MRFARAASIVVVALSAAGTLTATAFAAEKDSSGGFGPSRSPLERAKEESGVEGRPATRYAVPGGRLAISPTELLAGRSGQRMRFTVTLAQPAPNASLLVRLPASWLAVSAAGLPTTRGPALSDRAGGRAGLRRSGTVVELAIEGGLSGDRASFEVTDVGIPAGTYALPFYWRDAAGRTSRAGTATVVLYAPSRDAPRTGLASPGIASNVSNDAIEESESFIAVDPVDRNRIAAGINWQAPSMPAWITNDGGQNWVQQTMPETIDAPGSPSPESGTVCCDPTFAADDLGNIWFGGVASANSPAPSRIVINRIGAGTTSFQAQTVGLRVPSGATGTEDKPMMTIDNSPTSSTYGRLYVVWGSRFSGGIRVVVATCDTRPGGFPNAANCDNADNWTAPARVTASAGSYIYADVAVGPTGKAFVTWWDYSSTNAIRGTSCDPSAADCTTTAGWSATPEQTVAQLDDGGTVPGSPVPFACPILAQPGGRAGPDPSVDVDRSGGPNNGRVYVTWSDLRPGSGSTRCTDTGTPQSTHLTWDSFAAIGAAPGVLPGPAARSTIAGTRLLTDGEGGGQPNSDEWFPWLAVDQSSGQAWADFYSTRDDASRKTTNFYARSVTPAGAGVTLGPLNKVSAGASDYSAITPTNPCCNFRNDYGDYTGLDAAGGFAYPVWTDNSTGNGEARAFVSTRGPQAPTVATGAASVPSDQAHANLDGTVTPNGRTTTYFFEYGTTSGYGTKAPVPDGAAGAGGSAQSVLASLSGLAPNTTYHYRLVAANATGPTQGVDRTFTTAAPTVTTDPPTAVTAHTATLNGALNARGQDATYHFVYGTSPSDEVSTPDQNLAASSTDTAVSASVPGLQAGTPYHYRLVATNGVGTTPATDVHFTTLVPPTAVTGGSAASATSATVAGTVNPHGLATHYRFEYGTTMSYGSRLPIPDGDAGNGSTDVPRTGDLTGLSPSTVYHYRLVAISAADEADGSDMTFTTSAGGGSPPPPSGGGGTTTYPPPASGGTNPTPPASNPPRPAFTFSLSFPSQRLGTVLARRAVRASAGCAATCRLGARLTAPAGTARLLGLTRGRGSVELGRSTIARASARLTSLSIPLSRRALRALAGRTLVGIELRVTGTPLDRRAAITRAVRLTLRRRGTSPTVTALRASAATSPVWLGWDALGALRG